jgi:FkbM family methyltransferase
LFSASLSHGHNVQIDAFEPFGPNVARFCESIGLNHWSASYNNNYNHRPSINVWQMGVSDQKGTLSFLPSLTNPGAGTFLHNEQQKQELSRIERNRLQEVPVTTLDDFVKDQGWFDAVPRPNITILKIDVEKHESPVVKGATRLIRSGMVQNIFTEISKDNFELQLEMIQTFLEGGYHLVGQGNYRGPADKPTFGSNINSNSMAGMAKNIEKLVNTHDGPFLNVWWSLDPNANSRNFKGNQQQRNSRTSRKPPS